MDNQSTAQPTAVPNPVTEEQQMTQTIAASYVDDYAPPAVAPAGAAPVPAPTVSSATPAPTVSSATPAPQPVTPPPMEPVVSTPAPVESVVQAPTPVVTPAPVVAPTPAPAEPAPIQTPPVPPVVTSPAEVVEPEKPAQVAPTKVSQALEDQNIFHLLGIENISDSEKESFLDELQQVIWDDFLENDVELLITEEEMVDFKKISTKQGMKEEELQGEMIDFLEKLIPDLEKIMLEKALELKEEMMRERLSNLKTVYKDKPDLLAKVTRAAALVDDQQWRAAADELNSIR